MTKRKLRIRYESTVKTHPFFGKYITNGTVPGQITIRWPGYNDGHIITSESSKTEIVFHLNIDMELNKHGNNDLLDVILCAIEDVVRSGGHRFSLGDTDIVVIDHESGTVTVQWEGM